MELIGEWVREIASRVSAWGTPLSMRVAYIITLRICEYYKMNVDPSRAFLPGQLQEHRPSNITLLVLRLPFHFISPRRMIRFCQTSPLYSQCPSPSSILTILSQERMHFGSNAILIYHRIISIILSTLKRTSLNAR
jgi:hypothetical protein